MKNGDVKLIQRILAGDQTAFESLLTKYRKQVHAHAWRRTGDFHIAEDITQETFLQVYQKLETLEEPTQFSRWLHAIVNRLCIAWYRKNPIHTESLEETDCSEIEIDAYSRYVAEEQVKTTAIVQSDVVHELLTKLKESDRQVVTLHYFKEMTYSEIGSYLGVSESTIKSRLHRARKRLQKYEFMIQEALDITMEEGHHSHREINGGIGMNLTFERDDLLYSLQVLQDIGNGEDTSPILSNIFIHAAGDTIECMATDTEIGIRMKVEGTVREEGRIVISAQKLADIVKGWQSEKPINLATTASGRIEISGGNGVHKNVKISDEEFPNLPAVDDKAIAIDGDSLRSVLDKTKYAVPTDEEKIKRLPKGLYFNLFNDRTEVVATDGLQLALAHCEPFNLSDDSDGFIVPLKAVQEIERTFGNSPEIKIARIENQILFADDHVTLTTKLINADYPQYQQILRSSYDGRVVVKKEPFLNVVREVALLSNPKFPSVFLDIDEQKIRISPKLSAPDEECETVAVDSGVGSVNIRLISRMLTEALEHIRTEAFALEFSSTVLPVVIKPIDEDEEAQICIMAPMRLDA